MKKFFEKHDLFKLAGIFMLISVLLTWLCSMAYYQDGTLITDAITRAGVFDLVTYALLGMYYFTAMFIFIFVVSGFYKFLGTTDAYQKLTLNIADFFAKNGHEKVFVAISMLLFALLASVVNEFFVLFALIPFFISILSKMKVDKITGLSATFGGILVGILASTYSSRIVGQLVANIDGITYGYELITVIFLFAIAYLLLLFFTFVRMNKWAAFKKKDPLEDPFYTEKLKDNKKMKKMKVSVLPMAFVLLATFVLLILAFISWDNALGVTVFTDAYEWVTAATLFDTTIYSYLLGNIYSFGNWDLFAGACLVFIAVLIIKIVYHIPFDQIIESFGEGFKKISKTVVVLLLVYATLEFTVIYPTIPGLVDQIMGFGTNIFTMFISGALTSLFTVDFQYTANLIGSLFNTFENTNVAALALQTFYGVVGFIAPISAILMLGLSLLNIKYSEWFKHIWKYVVALVVVVLIILAILTYV